MSSAAFWKKKIKKDCTVAGTMHESFQSTIDTLSTILEQRDKTWEQFVKEGRQVVIKRVSDRGAVNSGKNPLFVAWCELNTQALSYWRELGLTAKGLKSITETINEDKEDPLDKVLEKLGR